MFQRFLCAIGLHKWGKWYKVSVHHLGEYPWDVWQHICTASRRTCQECGWHSRMRNLCSYPIKSLPNQR